MGQKNTTQKAIDKEMTPGFRIAISIRPFIKLNGTAEDIDKLIEGIGKSIDREIEYAKGRR